MGISNETKKGKEMKLSITTGDLKWRGKNKSALPEIVHYELAENEALSERILFKGRDGHPVLDPKPAREWLVRKIASDYGKTPSNKFWFHLGFSR